jgi:fumarylacetoacetase
MQDTENPQLSSWIESANDPTTDFPIQNLPLGVFTHGDGTPSIGIAIGDRILSLRRCADSGLLSPLGLEVVNACQAPSLDGLMALGPASWRSLRGRVSALLRRQSPEQQQNRQRIIPMLLEMAECSMSLPCVIGDYTDFYASIHHARNVGMLFRPDNPLMPNYKHIPVGYHGRASSIVVSGTAIRRPMGQTREAQAELPSLGFSRALDYEVEIGFLIGVGNPLGRPIPLQESDAHIFGLCLMNDWSARDIQAWEYQPLGPFLSKNFGTTISPWIVSMDALEPFRVPAQRRAQEDPDVLPYLKSDDNLVRGGFDVTVEVCIRSERMRAAAMEPERLGRSNLREMYWTAGQMVAHHTITGCNLRTGDLLGSGTISGTTRDSLGCLLERTRRGSEPLSLPTGEIRRFLEDGDEVIIRGSCQREGFARIGFGDCCGTIVSGES